MWDRRRRRMHEKLGVDFVGVAAAIVVVVECRLPYVPTLRRVHFSFSVCVCELTKTYPNKVRIEAGSLTQSLANVWRLVCLEAVLMFALAHGLDGLPRTCVCAHACAHLIYAKCITKRVMLTRFDGTCTCVYVLCACVCVWVSIKGHILCDTIKSS